MKALLSTWSVALLLPGCGSSASQPMPDYSLVAEAELGPAGGTLTVPAGALAGLSLQVPPGALAATTTVRVLRQVWYLSSQVPPVGIPVRLEPTSLEFWFPATLRLPYYPSSLPFTAPGNVRVQHQSLLGERRLEPTAVDVTARWCECSLAILGDFAVVSGPVASLADYLPANAAPVVFDSGLSFTSEVVVGEPNFGMPVTRWTIADDDGASGLYLASSSFACDVVGRFGHVDGGWQELWSQGVPLFRDEATALAGQPVARQAWVFAPFGTTTASGGGSVLLDSVFRLVAPMQIGSRRLLDVLELRAVVDWQRSDLGAGSQELVLWLSPGIGAVALRRDGRLHQRAGL